MKKLVAILMILIMSFTMLSAFAETVTEPESEFEKVLLKKGTLIVKEFIDCKRYLNEDLKPKEL